MQRWIRRIRAVFGMGSIWAIGWAVVGGAVMEGIVDPHGRILDMWPQTLGIGGFLAGAVFSVVLGIAAGRRSFGELSLVRFGVWGAAAGVILGVLLGWGVTIIVPIAALSAASASGSLALARKAKERALIDAGSGQGSME
jgi:hypothetical protein